jgi:hypothetical protein
MLVEAACTQLQPDMASLHPKSSNEDFISWSVSRFCGQHVLTHSNGPTKDFKYVIFVQN